VEPVVHDDFVALYESVAPRLVAALSVIVGDGRTVTAWSSAHARHGPRGHDGVSARPAAPQPEPGPER
jgi:hypothetical protein